MRKFIPLFASFFFALYTKAQTVELVKDINTQINNHNGISDYFVKKGNVAYFFADDKIHGKELWRSDGSEIGTYMVKDINIGSESSIELGYENITVLGNSIYFRANEGGTEKVLWKSDGTETGTIKVESSETWINSFLYNPAEITSCNGKIFFAAQTNQGFELCVSDGTQAGTFTLKDLNPGSGWSYPKNFTKVGNYVYFTNGPDLWRTDGTTANTYLVKSMPILPQNPQSNYFYKLTDYNGILYFGYGHNQYGNYEIGEDLWRSDGTTAGTFQVQFALSFVKVKDMIVFSNQIYFCGYLGSSVDCELWKTDGTSGGTLLVKNLNNSSSSSHPEQFMIVNQSLFFKTSTGNQQGKLWKSDGTNSGTTDFYSSSSIGDVYLKQKLNNSLVFTDYTLNFARELYQSDGTSQGTVLIKDIFPGSNSNDGSSNSHSGIDATNTGISYIEMNGFAIFKGRENSIGPQLWRTNLTEQGTYKIKEPYAANGDSYPTRKLLHNGNLYFSCASTYQNDITNGLYVTDGTSQNTTKISSGLISNLTALGTSIVFAKSSWIPSLYGAGGTYGNANLWLYNGTSLSQLKNITVNHNYLNLEQDWIVFNGFVYFISTGLSASEYSSGIAHQLWKTDGTVAGTQLVKNITGQTQPNYYGIGKPNFHIYNNTLFFTASTFDEGLEIWKTDGTTTGTSILKDIYPGMTSGISEGKFINLNGFMFFLAKSNGYYTKLFKSDGTTNGTQEVSGLPSFTQIAKGGNRLYLFTGVDLWVSDGTFSGSSLFKEYVQIFTNGLPEVSFNYPLFEFNDEVLFYGKVNTVQGLYKTDFANQELIFIKELLLDPGSFVTHITKPFIHNNKLYFSAKLPGVNEPNGFELWETDGTSAGTKLYEINEFKLSSSPGDFYEFNNELYFSAESSLHGRELWKLAPNPCPSTLSISSPNYTSETLSRQASNTNGLITATNQITNTARIDYQSKAILLDIGFKAEPSAGGYFKAEIGGCN